MKPHVFVLLSWHNYCVNITTESALTFDTGDYQASTIVSHRLFIASNCKKEYDFFNVF